MYISPRMFQLWLYTASHRQLLLRSTKAEHLNTRVDILFKDVSAIVLPPAFHGLQIGVCEESELPAKLGFKIGKHSLYRIKSEGTTGYLAASSVTVHEDEGEYFDPSALLPRGIALS